MPVSVKLTTIQNRENPNDIFYTPIDICKKAIEMVDNKPEYVWFDPWKGGGNFFNNFPQENAKLWCEIQEGRDFFEFNEKVDVICSNPPFSKINKCLEKCVELSPKHIILILGCINVTPKRLKYLIDNGYTLKNLHFFKVRGWFSISYILHFEKLGDNENNNLKFSYDLKEYKFVATD